jgi:murein L,D-transpeptidase YcbB/YkuD
MKSIALGVLLALASAALSSLPAYADLQAELRHITEHLVLDGEGNLPSGGVIYQPAIIEQHYYETNYEPTWTDRAQVERVLGILAQAGRDGLDPEHYHYSELRALLDASEVSMKTDNRVRAKFDVMLTDGAILYVRHLLQGKVDPHIIDPTFNYSRLRFEPAVVSKTLREAIANETIATLVQDARPRRAFYAAMRDALARYRELAATESFVRIPDDAVLKPGQAHANVPPLRRRLAELGFLEPAADHSSQFDDTLEQAVRSFQQHNNLDVDGVVGSQSFALLNLSWSDRVDLLRINMDRLRWIYRDLTDNVVVVNIAGFELYYLRKGKPAWETPVMVGTIAHQTPIFTDRLRYLEFNPTWTVPRSIIRRSLFPKFRADPQAAIDGQYHLIDRTGQLTDPLQIDWSAYNGSNFPYNVVQQPGPQNALGRVKFMFPNRHAIYLHDTPSRALFSRSSRAFSAGCVRVQDPLAFAELLLDDPDKWSLQQIQDLVDSGRPVVRVNLDRPVDIMLMYWTTSPTPAGRIQFHPDVYGKDPQTLAALNAPPKVYGLPN